MTQTLADRVKALTSVSARPEFLGVIDDPLFENLGSLANLEGQNFFMYDLMYDIKVFEECPLS